MLQDRNSGQPSQRESEESARAKGRINRRELLKTTALLASAATVGIIADPLSRRGGC
jgi:hypothetical protein